LADRVTGAASTVPQLAAECTPMPADMRMRTIDQRLVRVPVGRIFALARHVEAWPQHLPHYRWVHYLTRAADGSGIVEMSANRPFGPLAWPTWWRSAMWIDESAPVIRFRHIAGVTTGMEVEWSFAPNAAGTMVKIVHCWNGPEWPVIGGLAATAVIGPVFIHGIASRTLAGLAQVAERDARSRT
jgi:ribosome-associated toxin RatA of RatAB toxin-antitoxin module